MDILLILNYEIFKLWEAYLLCFKKTVIYEMVYKIMSSKKNTKRSMSQQICITNCWNWKIDSIFLDCLIYLVSEICGHNKDIVL